MPAHISHLAPAGAAAHAEPPPARARRKRLGRRAVLAAALPVAFTAFALPGAAQAADVNASAGKLFVVDRSFTGGVAENNDVQISVLGSSLVVKDDAGITIDPRNDAGCIRFNGNEARCVLSRVASVDGFFGPGADKIDHRAFIGGSMHMGDGLDRVFGGRREASGRAIQSMTYAGGSGSDAIGYGGASAGVVVDMADGLANDGKPGERDNVAADFEQLEGSDFADTLFGTPQADIIFGFGGRDIVAGGGGDDVFFTPLSSDGADDYHGGPGRDTIDYNGRTQPLTVTLDNVAADGESGEFDNVRSNVENVNGGAGQDTIESFGAFSRLDGRGARDILKGGDGPDTLIGGPGNDALESGSGIDVVDARDNEPDFVDCGTEADSLSRDVGEGTVRNCESIQVGVLRLTPGAASVAAGKAARLQLDWRHPQDWRKLRSVTLRLLHDDVAVGEVTIDPRGGKVTADGAVDLVSRASRVTHKGKAATARLALRIDASQAGRQLDLEVEATDVNGRRQLERGAGTLRVAR